MKELIKAMDKRVKKEEQKADNTESRLCFTVKAVTDGDGIPSLFTTFGRFHSRFFRLSPYKILQKTYNPPPYSPSASHANKSGEEVVTRPTHTPYYSPFSLPAHCPDSFLYFSFFAAL